jgi:hypothetical protein
MSTAQLVNCRALLPIVLLFAADIVVPSACLRLLDVVSESKRWRIWVPSAVAISIGLSPLVLLVSY